MNPFLFQKKKHHWKLLSSKFVYPSVNTLPQINQLTNALLCSSKELAVNAAIMASLFGQKPTFAKSKISRSQAFRLQQVSVTASNSGALTKALSSLSRSILPFQQENSLREINVPKDKRIS
jgi:hypothetical protein